MHPAQRVQSVFPTAVAMLICDHVWKDPCDGKTTIIGTFSTLNADRFPFRHPLVAVYLALTNGHGQVPVTLRLVDVDDQFDPIFELNKAFEFKDPHVLFEEGIEISHVLFPRPGEHRLQLLAHGQLLIERRLSIRQRLTRNRPDEPFS
jgi:hypothetical protein